MSTIRDLLLRAQRDLAFAELVRTDPDRAVAGYELTGEEFESLRRLDRSLYRYLVPAHRLSASGAVLAEKPPEEEGPDLSMTLPDTTLPDLSDITVPLVTIEEDVLARESEGRVDAARRQAQLDEVRASSGPERRAKLEILLEELG